MFIVLFSKCSTLSGAGSSAEAGVAIGTGLHASFLPRKRPGHCNAVCRVDQGSSHLACYFARRESMSQEIPFSFPFFFLLKLLFMYLYFQVIVLPVAKDSDFETQNHN